MKNLLKFVMVLALIVLALSVIVLALNGLVYLAFYYETFKYCFGAVCIIAMAYCFLKQISVSIDSNYRFMNWMGNLVFIGLFMEYVLFIGPAIAGGYSIEETSDGVFINHRIFPFNSKNLLSCRDARELEVDLPLKDFGN